MQYNYISIYIGCIAILQSEEINLTIDEIAIQRIFIVWLIYTTLYTADQYGGHQNNFTSVIIKTKGSLL